MVTVRGPEPSYCEMLQSLSPRVFGPFLLIRVGLVSSQVFPLERLIDFPFLCV